MPRSANGRFRAPRRRERASAFLINRIGETPDPEFHPTVDGVTSGPQILLGADPDPQAARATETTTAKSTATSKR
jgi:hypothetical protein